MRSTSYGQLDPCVSGYGIIQAEFSAVKTTDGSEYLRYAMTNAEFAASNSFEQGLVTSDGQINDIFTCADTSKLSGEVFTLKGIFF